MKRFLVVVFVLVFVFGLSVPCFAFEYEFDPASRYVHFNDTADMDQGSFMFATGSYMSGFQGDVYYLNTQGLNSEYHVDFGWISYPFRSHGLRTFIRPDYDQAFDPMYLQEFDFDFMGKNCLEWMIYSGCILGTGITGTQRIGPNYSFYDFQHVLGYGVYIFTPQLTVWRIDRSSGSWTVVDTSNYSVDVEIRGVDAWNGDDVYSVQSFYDHIKRRKSSEISRGDYPWTGYNVNYKIVCNESVTNVQGVTLPDGIPVSRRFDYCVQIAFNQYATVQPPLHDFPSFVGYAKLARYQQIHLVGYFNVTDALTNPDFRDWLQVHPDYTTRISPDVDISVADEIDTLVSPFLNFSGVLNVFGLDISVRYIIEIAVLIFVGGVFIAILKGVNF